ncbi:MAG TPA: DUF6544 family protein [Xenococcaceae cyanobacterium]
MLEVWLIIVTIAIAILIILALIQVRYNRTVTQVWQSLQSQPTNSVFTGEMVANLAEPVQRYFLHAIAPGTPLASSVELQMIGSFRLKPDAAWIPMTAAQIISTAGGFVWQAKIGQGLSQFSGADYYTKSQSKMKFSLWGLIPLVDAANSNINRSAIGRLGAEYCIWLPSALLPQNGVTWQAISDDKIQADFTIEAEPIALTLTIDAEGKLLKLSLPRWGDRTATGNWQYIPFGSTIQAEKTWDGYTVPSKMNAGWWFDTDKYEAFFQPIIEQATYS